MNCLFCQFAQDNPRTLPSLVFSDESVFVLNDHQPQAPIHQLIIPKKHIATLNDLTLENTELIGHLFQIARQQANKTHIAEKGYRTVFNCNSEGGQTIDHLHLHLLGGRPLQWPPG